MKQALRDLWLEMGNLSAPTVGAVLVVYGAFLIALVAITQK